jgi:NodT family efflux transporter outer membrane factor (OMF) lipoprotein
MLLTLCSAASLLFLTGCVSVGPDYEAPAAHTPDRWHESAMQEFGSGKASLETWWTVFGDDTLNALISRASTNNLSLKAAAARIEQAAALRGVSASQYFPDLSAGASASAIRTTSARTAPGADRRDEFYSAGLSMAWELDLWGRIRRSVESAEASLQASMEDYRDIMVVLYAEIASGYINVRTLQERIRLSEENLSRQTETLELTQTRLDSGLSPAIDVSQAELNTSRTASAIPPLRQQLTASINRLSVLTGDMPYALLKQLEPPKSIPAVSGQVVLGLPAELLRQRPDIRKAERQLAAQHARIGATQAELFPTLALPGSLTLEANDTDLFSSGNTAYSFGPQLRLNLFNGRRIRNQVDSEKAATEAARHVYEQTVLLALEEVEGALSAYANEKDRVESLDTAAKAAEKSVELVSELYGSGLTDFQTVLNLEQALLTQQDQLAASRGLISTYLVNVYKALGGGWKPDTVE